jgi:hypothetical protein
MFIVQGTVFKAVKLPAATVLAFTPWAMRQQIGLILFVAVSPKVPRQVQKMIIVAMLDTNIINGLTYFSNFQLL